MTISELLYNYDNDESFKNDLNISIKNKESRFVDGDLQNHKEDISNLEKNFLYQSIVNEIYPIELKVNIQLKVNT